MSNTTKYAVVAHTADSAEVVSIETKKSVAADIARDHRDLESVAVTVVTVATGYVAFDIAAPRKINMSPAYTRVVNVEDEHIAGKRVAYKRTRVGFALLDANATGAPNGTYSIYDLVNQCEVDSEVIEVRTTREAGRWFADEAPALRASLNATVEV